MTATTPEGLLAETCSVHLHDPLAPGQHRWRYATGMNAQVRHVLTSEMISLPTIVLVCECGALATRRVPDPS